MTGLETASLAIAAAVVAACGIWYGIRAMVHANKDRAAILDQQRQADERRHEETMATHAEAMAKADQRHEETMAALASQRDVDERRHEEAMQAHAGQSRALEALIIGLERQTASLETVIERTAPAAGPAE